MKKALMQLNHNPEALSLNVFDVGARRGVFSDLIEIAPHIAMYGFEPDVTECERLNNSLLNTAGPWHTLKYMPYALGREKGHIGLNLYSQPGCSSSFRVDLELAKAFSREDYYGLEGTFDMVVHPMDELIEKGEIPFPDFIKIDVQGMEMDVFEGGLKSFESLVGLRTEVSFRSIYPGQPLFSDIDDYLRAKGLVPIRFLEFHSWRRLTKKKYPNLSTGKVPYSEGEMIHSDILYLANPDYINIENLNHVEKYTKAALIALCYRQYDYACKILENKKIESYFKEITNVDPYKLISKLSIYMKQKTFLDRLLCRLRIKLKKDQGII